ncbi:hypothetical protein AVEN_248210-1, partial [Araneus ventricosus]
MPLTPDLGDDFGDKTKVPKNPGHFVISLIGACEIVIRYPIVWDRLGSANGFGISLLSVVLNAS